MDRARPMLGAIGPPPLAFYGLLLLPVIACLAFNFGRDVASQMRWRVGSIAALLIGGPAAAVVIMMGAFALNFWLYRQISKVIISNGIWLGFDKSGGPGLFWISYCLVVFALCIGIRSAWRRLRQLTYGRRQ